MIRDRAAMAAFTLLPGLLAAAMLVGCGKAELTDTEYLRRATELHEQGEVRAAIIELKNALQANPKNASARLMLGQMYVSLADGASAEKELRRASELGAPAEDVKPALAKALLYTGDFQGTLDELSGFSPVEPRTKAESAALRSDAHLGLSDVDAAAEQARAAIEADPTALAGYLASIRVALANGDLAQAKTLAAEAEPLGEGSSEYWLQVGRLHLTERGYAEAEAALSKALGLEPKGVVTPRSFTARSELAFALIGQNKDDAAIEHIKLLLDADQNNPLANYQRGLVAYKQGQYADALPFLQRAHSAMPKSPQVLMLLGAANFAERNYRQAETYLSTYVAANPGNVQAQKLLASTRIKLKEPEKAVLGLKQALEASPEDAELLSMLGGAAMQSGDVRAGQTYIKQAVESGRDSPELRMQLATAYIAEGQLDAAVRELETGAEMAHGALKPEIALVLAYVRKQDLRAAEQRTAQLLEEHPTEPAVHSLLGAVKLAQNETAAATAAFNKALAIDPDYWPALLNLGRLESEQGNLAAARGYFEQALDADGKNASVMVALARLDEQEGRPGEAVAWLERARAADDVALPPRLLLGRYYLSTRRAQDALAVTNEAYGIAPQAPIVLALRADAQMATGNFAAAAETLERLATKAPDAASVQLKLGQAYLALEENTKAKAALERTLALAPDTEPAIVGLGLLELKQGDREAATVRAKKAQADLPKAAAGFVLEGEVLMSTNDFAGAAKAYAAALRRAESSALALKYAAALTRAGNKAAAEKYLDEWLEAHPEDQQVRLAVATELQRVGNHEAAVPHYERLTEAQPENAVFLNNLAWSYMEVGDARALGTAERAHKLQPESVPIADTYGWIMLHQGDAKAAKDILGKAAYQAPDSLDIQYHYAAALAKLGDKEEARRLLRRILESDKTFADKEAVRQFYETL